MVASDEITSRRPRRTSTDPLRYRVCFQPMPVSSSWMQIALGFRTGSPSSSFTITTMIGQVEASGTAEAMAMASVLAVLGPADVRPADSSATARLAAAGIATPQWAAGLG
jgi:hypothetical protein